IRKNIVDYTMVHTGFIQIRTSSHSKNSQSVCILIISLENLTNSLCCFLRIILRVSTFSFSSCLNSTLTQMSLLDKMIKSFPIKRIPLPLGLNGSLDQLTTSPGSFSKIQFG